MNGKRLDIEISTLGKAFVIFILLLIFSFVLGLYLGRESGKSSPPPEKAGACAEQLNACSYKLQEISGKMTALSAVAREKGILDESGAVNRELVCLPPVKPAAPPAPEKQEVVAASAEQPIPAAAPQKQPEEKKDKKDAAACRYSLQIYAGRSPEEAQQVQKRSKIKPLRLVEGVVNDTTWYRLRYGCYPDKSAAEEAIAELKELGAHPIIASE
jgi:septal ring-binding cell division protein DamX